MSEDLQKLTWLYKSEKQILKWLKIFAAIKPSLLTAYFLSQSPRGLEEYAHGKKTKRGEILSSGQRVGSPVVVSVVKRAGERRSCSVLKARSPWVRGNIAAFLWTQRLGNLWKTPINTRPKQQRLESDDLTILHKGSNSNENKACFRWPFKWTQHKWHPL